MLDFIFDAGFDGLLVGKAGDRSRARRAQKTLRGFVATGTATFPGALRSRSGLQTGYLTVRQGHVVFSRVSGAAMDHTDVDLSEIGSFSVRENRHKYLPGISKWWTVVETEGAAGVVLACVANGRDCLIKVLAETGIAQVDRAP